MKKFKRTAVILVSAAIVASLCLMTSGVSFFSASSVGAKQPFAENSIMVYIKTTDELLKNPPKPADFAEVEVQAVTARSSTFNPYMRYMLTISQSGEQQVLSAAAALEGNALVVNATPNYIDIGAARYIDYENKKCVCNEIIVTLDEAAVSEKALDLDDFPQVDIVSIEYLGKSLRSYAKLTLRVPGAESIKKGIEDLKKNELVKSAEPNYVSSIADDTGSTPSYSGLIGDVDGDGEYTASDALLVLQRAVGKIDRFPVEGNSEPASSVPASSVPDDNKVQDESFPPEISVIKDETPGRYKVMMTSATEKDSVLSDLITGEPAFNDFYNTVSEKTKKYDAEFFEGHDLIIVCDTCASTESFKSEVSVTKEYISISREEFPPDEIHIGIVTTRLYIIPVIKGSVPENVAVIGW